MSATAIEPPMNAAIRGRGEKRATEFSRILPLLVLFLLFFDLPILIIFGWSFRVPKETGVTFQNYIDLFTSTLYLRIVWRTVGIAAIVTVACGLLGYPLALWMTRQSA